MWAIVRRRRDEARLRSIFRASPAGMGVVDRRRVLAEVNDTLCAMLGYAREELIGQSARLLYPSDADYAYVGREKYRQIAVSGRGTLDTRLRCKDGRVLDVLLSSAPMDLDDPDSGVTFTALDIGDRKRAEAQAQRWQRVFEEAEFGLAHANAADNTFIEVNRAFARQRGYSPEELAGRPMVDAYPPDLREAMAQRLSTIDTAHHLTFESVHVRKDGSRFPVLMEVTNIQGPGGEPVSRIAYALDITEQRRLAEELDGYRLRLEDLVASRTRELAEARTRAEAANQAKSVFPANMSHEIRTPMNAIMGLTHLMQTSGVTPDQAQRLARIDEAARHLLAIVNDILDLSRIDAGHLELEDRDFALAEVLVRFEVQDTGIGIDPGATGPAVRPLRTGGRVHHPPLRRDRPGADHHPAPGRGHGWGVGAGASAIGGLVGPRCAGRPPPHAALGPLDGRPAAEAAGQARAVGEVVGAPPAAVRAGLARSAGAGTPAPRRPSPP